MYGVILFYFLILKFAITYNMNLVSFIELNNQLFTFFIDKFNLIILVYFFKKIQLLMILFGFRIGCDLLIFF